LLVGHGFKADNGVRTMDSQRTGLADASRRLLGTAALITAMSVLTGCASSTSPWLGIAAPAAQSQTAAVPAAKLPLGELARAQAQSPSDPKLGLQYARALKAAGKPKEALAVLDALPEGGPLLQPLLVEHGLIALELGKTTRARQLLLRATAEKTKDWRVFSGLGIASSSLGMHAEAQGFFAKALELSPNNPTVLNNMAMSMILDKKLTQAEGLLQKATDGGSQQARTKSNLALAKALRSDPAIASGSGQAGSDDKPAGAVEVPSPKAKHAAATDTGSPRVD